MGKIDLTAKIAELREELFAQRRTQQLPKHRVDWFFLRERWNWYSDGFRLLVLKVAGITENIPLEKYSKAEKRAIALAIIDINTFAKADQDYIAREKGKWQRLYQADE